eukprot:gene53401-71387_t
MDEGGDFEQEWTIEFHGSQYIIFMQVLSSVLSIEAEHSTSTESSFRWRGEFTSQYIEEITQKAGNFKKFTVFIKMLASAFSKDSDSVFVDLLTYNDLEVLKARKSSTNMSSSSLSTSTSISSNPKSLLKRYIILTYSGEFDRVHFPLPLAHEDSPTVP